MFPARARVHAAATAGGWERGRALRLEGVRVARGAVEILQGVDFTFEPGRRYVVIGPSGAGKSTLLRLLNRLEDPSAGRIWIGDRPLESLPIRAVRTAVGLVLQAPRPLPGTMAENLAYPDLVRRRPPPSPEAMARSLEATGLDPRGLDRDASSLSGGERQRLALAMALAAGPEILALDEPTSALDPASARRIADLLADLAAREGLRTISVCHHRAHAPWLGEEALVLDRGRIVDRGPTVEVLARNADLDREAPR